MSLSPERKGRLTASNFCAAMGLSKYQSRQSLYRQIKGIDPKFEGNEATQYGIENEPNAVDAYEINQGVILLDSGNNQKFVIHPYYDWLGATCDGRTQERLVEFKCPYYEMYKDIPEQYIPQVMGQMAITGYKQADLVAWTPEELKIWRIEFSEEYWKIELDLLHEFWEHIQKDEEPKRKKKAIMPEIEYELLF